MGNAFDTQFTAAFQVVLFHSISGRATPPSRELQFVGCESEKSGGHTTSKSLHVTSAVPT
jgi:hypothetical protein